MPEANSSCGVRRASAHTTTVSARSSDSAPSATRRSRAPATRPSDDTMSEVASVPVTRVNSGSPPAASAGKIVPGAVRGSGPEAVAVTAMGMGCGRRSCGPAPS